MYEDENEARKILNGQPSEYIKHRQSCRWACRFFRVKVKNCQTFKKAPPQKGAASELLQDWIVQMPININRS